MTFKEGKRPITEGVDDILDSTNQLESSAPLESQQPEGEDELTKNFSI